MLAVYEVHPGFEWSPSGSSSVLEQYGSKRDLRVA